MSLSMVEMIGYSMPLSGSPGPWFHRAMYCRRSEPSELERVVQKAYSQIKAIGEMSYAQSEDGFESRYRLYETVCELHVHVNIIAERSPREGDFRKEAERAIQKSLEYVSPLVFATQKAFQRRLAFLQNQHHLVLEKVYCLQAITPPTKVFPFEELIRSGEGLDCCPPSCDPQKSYQLLARFEQVLSAFQEQVESIEDSLQAEFLGTLRFTRTEVDQIFQGALTNWRSLIEETENGFIWQKHSIRRLKIYKLPGTPRLIADIGMDEIASGSYKRVKEVQRLGGQTLVRLTPVQYDEFRHQSSQNALDKTFTREMHHELAIHEMLAGIPHIAGISCIQYYNRERVFKTRYFMQKYDGDLWQLVITSKSEFNTRRALLCYKDIIDCIKEIHGRGFVYGDPKLSNGLYRADFGFLCDFGLTCMRGEEIQFIGTPEYMAPELLGGVVSFADPATDIFSLGIMLFGIANPNRHNAWMRDIRALTEKIRSRRNALDSQTKQFLEQAQSETIDPQLLCTVDQLQKKAAFEARRHELLQQQDNLDADYMKEYVDLLLALMRDLEDSAAPFDALVRRLISYDPHQRPNIIQLDEEFTGKLISLGIHTPLKH